MTSIPMMIIVSTIAIGSIMAGLFFLNEAVTENHDVIARRWYYGAMVFFFALTILMYELVTHFV